MALLTVASACTRYTTLASYLLTMNQDVVLGGEASTDESGVAMVPLDVAERGVITNEVLGAVLRSLPEDSECFVVLDCCHAGTHY